MSGGPWTRPWLVRGCLMGVAFITVLDGLIPGVVVGILLAIPIALASLADDPREVWLVTVTAAVGFVMAAAFGHGPITPAVVWVPNRILAFLTIPAAGSVALLIQRRRLQLEEARQEAVRSSDLNRLLTSLLAHDLRAPLGTALQAIDYLTAAGPGAPPEPGLADDVRSRLRRSLGTIDAILSLARADADEAAAGGAPATPRTGGEIAREIEAEVQSFSHEAAAQGKMLRVELPGDEETTSAADLLVLRRTVAILVDNAVRHALPGTIRVTGRVSGGELALRVEDEGPGLRRRRPGGEPGSGLGLDLCRALVSRAGGSLEVARDEESGTHFELRMPLGPAG